MTQLRAWLCLLLGVAAVAGVWLTHCPVSQVACGAAASVAFAAVFGAIFDGDRRQRS